MRKSNPIQLIVHSPKTVEGKRELARRMSEVHADFVFSRINKLDCLNRQKLDLLQAVIDTTKGTYKVPDAPVSEKCSGLARKNRKMCL